MRRATLAAAIIIATGTIATPASAQTSTASSGPAFSWRYFTTPLEKDATRVVQAQQQLHLPNRPGNPVRQA